MLCTVTSLAELDSVIIFLPMPTIFEILRNWIHFENFHMVVKPFTKSCTVIGRFTHLLRSPHKTIDNELWTKCQITVYSIQIKETFCSRIITFFDKSFTMAIYPPLSLYLQNHYLVLVRDFLFNRISIYLSSNFWPTLVVTWPTLPCQTANYEVSFLAPPINFFVALADFELSYLLSIVKGEHNYSLVILWTSIDQLIKKTVWIVYLMSIFVGLAERG